MRISTAIGGALLLVTACTSHSSEATNFTVTDSAGVRIVESSGPSWRDGERWQLADRPSVQVGVVEGDPRYQFNFVAAGRFLPGGGFAVVDQSQSLRAFSKDGAFVWSAGRQGDGPGEFRRASAFRVLPPDSLIVFDGGNERISIFTTSGSFARSAKLDAPPGVAHALRDVFLTPDRTLVVTAWGSTGLLGVKGRPPEGMSREKDPVFRFSTEGGAPLATIGEYEGLEWYATEGGIGPPPFGHRTVFAVRDTTLIVGTSETLSLDVRSFDGTLREVIRVPGVDLTVTRADAEAYRALVLSHAPADEAVRKQVLARLDALPMPETKAAYSQVLVDALGDLWVADAVVSTTLPTRWRVFAPDGHLLGDITVPDRAFRILDIGDESMLAVWKDGMDVEHVGVYAIRK